MILKCNAVIGKQVLLHKAPFQNRSFFFPYWFFFFLPQSYDEEELAAAWNSCARLSCLEHGFTIHSSFDLVPPYPRFEPRISLKCDSSVVINTGNLLHCLNFNLEKAKCKSNNKTGQNPAPAELMKFAQQWASATVNPHLFRYVREMKI